MLWDKWITDQHRYVRRKGLMLPNEKYPEKLLRELQWSVKLADLEFTFKQAFSHASIYDSTCRCIWGQTSSPATPVFRRSQLGLSSQPPVGPAMPPLPSHLHPGLSQPCSLLQGSCHPISPGQSQLTLVVVVYACPVASGSSATPWTVAHQALLAMGFPRQEYWSGLPFPPSGNLPNPRIEPASHGGLLHWQVVSLPLSPLGSPYTS